MTWHLDVTNHGICFKDMIKTDEWWTVKLTNAFSLLNMRCGTSLTGVVPNGTPVGNRCHQHRLAESGLQQQNARQRFCFSEVLGHCMLSSEFYSLLGFKHLFWNIFTSVWNDGSNALQLSTWNASCFISPKHRILDSRFWCFKLISIAMLRGFGLMSWQNFWRLARDSSMSWEEMMALVHCAGNSVKGQNPLMHWQCCCNGQNPSNHLWNHVFIHNSQYF